MIAGIDGATGEVSLNEEVIFRELEQEMFICPSWAGGKDWETGAYSPLTRTMYFPLRQACAEMLVTTDFESEKVKARDQIVAHYALAANHRVAPGTDQLGTVRAISAETGETRWVYETRAATFSLLATGGGLLFGGRPGRTFPGPGPGDRRGSCGRSTWAPRSWGFPVTYAVSGRQYVAVNTGPGPADERAHDARTPPGPRQQSVRVRVALESLPTGTHEGAASGPSSATRPTSSQPARTKEPSMSEIRMRQICLVAHDPRPHPAAVRVGLRRRGLLPRSRSGEVRPAQLPDPLRRPVPRDGVRRSRASTTRRAAAT